MSNSYFQFKQFTVFQEKCAMKVGADGVTLGAWSNVESAKKILDIGTGTGLLALMLAQRSDAEIVAIDIENESVEQAKENVGKSPWKNRITVFHSSVQEFVENSSEKFDLIACNPPFFQNSQKSPSETRTTARHNDTLSHIDLIENSKKLLSEKGKLCVILPVNEGNQFIELSEKNQLYCSKKVTLFPNPEKPAKRLLLELKNEKCVLQESQLTIEQERHVYTPEYTELVKDFYLKL